MTNQQHPITPSLKLVELWKAQYYDYNKTFSELVTEVAQYGADQELEACCKWLDVTTVNLSKGLRATRRPKPLSLKKQALTALYAIATGANDTREQHQDFDTIRLALEQLPND